MKFLDWIHVRFNSCIIHEFALARRYAKTVWRNARTDKTYADGFSVIFFLYFIFGMWHKRYHIGGNSQRSGFCTYVFVSIGRDVVFAMHYAIIHTMQRHTARDAHRSCGDGFIGWAVSTHFHLFAIRIVYGRRKGKCCWTGIDIWTAMTIEIY